MKPKYYSVEAWIHTKTGKTTWKCREIAKPSDGWRPGHVYWTGEKPKYDIEFTVVREPDKDAAMKSGKEIIDYNAKSRFTKMAEIFKQEFKENMKT